MQLPLPSLLLPYTQRRTHHSADTHQGIRLAQLIQMNGKNLLGNNLQKEML